MKIVPSPAGELEDALEIALKAAGGVHRQLLDLGLSCEDLAKTSVYLSIAATEAPAEVKIKIRWVRELGQPIISHSFGRPRAHSVSRISPMCVHIAVNCKSTCWPEVLLLFNCPSLVDGLIRSNVNRHSTKRSLF